MGKITPLFRLIFFTVLSITVVFAVVHVLLVVMIPNPTDQAIALIGAASDTWQGGITAIFGLVGGKAAST